MFGPNDSLPGPSSHPLLHSLPPQPSPVSPDHQSIVIPLSSIVNGDSVNDEAAVEGKCHHPIVAFRCGGHHFSTNLLTRIGVSSDSQSQIPSIENRRSLQAETNLKDGSESLFSMYNEKALAFDSKHIENWREDANGLMILVRRRLPFH